MAKQKKTGDSFYVCLADVITTASVYDAGRVHSQRRP